MVSKGDALKASAEIRPKVVEYLQQFGVSCTPEEREKAARLSDSVSDYDPAGKFGYLMYSCLLTIGDEQVDDLVAYNYYMGTMGALISDSDEMSESYVTFLETMRNVADVDMGDPLEASRQIDEVGGSFEEYTVRTIRISYLKSHLFEHAVDQVVSDFRDTMLKGISVKPKRFIHLIREIHNEMISVCGDHMEKDDYERVIETVDDEVPLGNSQETALEIIEKFSEDAATGPLGALMKFVSDDVLEHLTNNMDDIAESMVLIRRSGMYMASLYTTIGTGKLGVDGNRALAYAIRDGLVSATDRADRKSTNVLKLPKQTMPEMLISLN